jgi:hypothetical protein
VERIFELAADGFTQSQIAKRLNAEGRETPQQAKERQGAKRNSQSSPWHCRGE